MKPVRKIIANTKGKIPVTSPALRVTADGSVRNTDSDSRRTSP